MIHCYARNDHLRFVIPYEIDGVAHDYLPDWLVRMADGSTLILETKGYESAEDRAKAAAAHKWVDAVNSWGGMGRWGYHVNYDPHRLAEELKRL